MPRFLRSPVIIPIVSLALLGFALLQSPFSRGGERQRPTVVYAHPPCPPELMKLYNPIFDEFRRTHPQIELKVLHITGNYEDKIKVMFAGGVAPDVIFMYPTALPAWAELGALLPLDEQLAKGRTRSSDYFAAMLDTFRYKGKLYGLPKDASATIMQYNVELFRRAGIEAPNERWTWVDLLRAAKALTKDSSGSGRVDQWGMNALPWWTLVWANGGRVLDETGTHCTLLEPAALEALEFWVDLRCKYGVTPSPTATADLSPSRLFELGRVAMHFEMYPIVSVFRKTCSFEWDLAPIPSGPKSRCTDAVGSALAVTAQSRNPDAAFEFVRWLTSEQGMKFLVTVESPSCVKLAHSDEFLQSAGAPKSKNVAIEAMEYTRAPIQHPQYAEIMDTLNSELNRAMLGKIGIREALENAVPKVDRVLKGR
jgi:multiple sugar transport system substrate-binding protein